jgi:hypothetical protein
MIGISGHDNIASLSRGALREMLHARYKRARRIYHFGCSLLEVALYLWRDAVRANNCGRISDSFVRRVDRRNATRAESLHLLRVVNQWPKRANRAHALFDSLFDLFHRALDAETESEFLCK